MWGIIYQFYNKKSVGKAGSPLDLVSIQISQLHKSLAWQPRCFWGTLLFTSKYSVLCVSLLCLLHMQRFCFCPLLDCKVHEAGTVFFLFALYFQCLALSRKLRSSVSISVWWVHAWLKGWVVRHCHIFNLIKAKIGILWQREWPTRSFKTTF